MIEYIIPHNLDDRVLYKAKEILDESGLVAFPSDTNWIICANPHKPPAVEKLYRIKGEEKSHHLSLLCDGVSLVSQYAFIPDFAFKQIRSKLPGHYTFIFEALKTTSKLLKASKSDKEVGIRVPPVDFIQTLIAYLGFPLLSTNIDPKTLGVENAEDIYSLMIDEGIHEIDLILDPGEYNFAGPSTIYRFLEGEIELIREGAGELL